MLSSKNIIEIKNVLSHDRYSTYYKLAKSNDLQALNLYKQNLYAANRMYIILHILEVCLRNKIDTILKAALGDEWLNDNTIPFSVLQKQMLKAATDNHANNQLIASLPFGFWTAFFGRPFEELWRHQLRQIFTANKLTRGEVAVVLQNVRMIRNRIAHHEIIINYNLKDCESAACNLLAMMSPITLQWLQDELLHSPPLGEEAEAISL